MIVSKNPPLIACSIGENAYSRKLIEETKEFVVNVPPKKLKKEIYYCGFHSGYKVNKFKQTGLTSEPAQKVKAPIIGECVAFMECQVKQIIKTGDKILFIGEVLEAYADEALAKKEKKVEYATGEFPHKVYGGRFNLI